MHTVVNASSCEVKFRSDSLSTVCTRVYVREIYLRFTLFQYICDISLKYHFILFLLVVNVFREQFKSFVLVYISNV